VRDFMGVRVRPAGHCRSRGSTSPTAGQGAEVPCEDPVTSSRSSTWRIWTGKKADDLYVCETKSGEDSRRVSTMMGEYGALP